MPENISYKTSSTCCTICKSGDKKGKNFNNVVSKSVGDYIRKIPTQNQWKNCLLSACK